MRILVTGHRGYVGTRLVPLLQASGNEVAGVDIGWFDGSHIEPARGLISELKIDIRQLNAGHLRGFDAVIHLAGVSNDPLGDLNPKATLEINYGASVRLAEFAKSAGVRRFLYASSCSLYGASGDVDDLLDENAAFHPVTPYGESKVLAEQGIIALADGGFCPTFLRCATVYGDSPMLRADLVVNNLVAHALFEHRVLLKSDGTPWRPLVHVDDVCQAYRSMVHAPLDVVGGRAFNVGRTEDNFQIKDVAERIEKIVPDCEICFAPGAGADTRCYRVNCDRLTKEIAGYRSRWTLPAGIRQLMRAYRDRGWSLAQLLGPDFMRIEKIQQLIAEGKLDSMLRAPCSTTHQPTTLRR